MIEMTALESEKLRSLIRNNCGIHLDQSKTTVLQAKLDKLLRRLNLYSYDEYFRLLTTGADQRIWRQFIDEITVHQSSFFRENAHFEFIRCQMRMILESNERIVKNREIRVWSASCSTGEEPYTAAMVLREWLPPEIDVRILATDISARALAVAQKGIYPPNIKKEMDPYYLLNCFTWHGDSYQIKPAIREMVAFRLFNLMEPFPFKEPFDLVFCRNVMIYFDRQVQQELIGKLHKVTARGGILFLGHSESLFDKEHAFKHLQPTIYQKR